MTAKRALPFLLLIGCGLFGGRGASRGGDGEPTTTSVHSHLDVTLINRCAHAVEVCYGTDKCALIAGGKARLVHAATKGNDVFVHFKDSDATVTADDTFSVIEVDSGCAHLERRLAPR